jgi:hypothetical protein
MEGLVISKRVRNLVLSAGVGILLASVISSILSAKVDPVVDVKQSSIGSPSPAQSVETGSSPVNPTPRAAPEGGSKIDQRQYAIDLAELRGLPADAAPGTVLDIFVAWDPPVTPRPTVQRLIRDVILERIVPPVTPDGPDAALLSVDKRQLTSLMFGDRYGRLSVALVPATSSP